MPSHGTTVGLEDRILTDVGGKQSVNKATQRTHRSEVPESSREVKGKGQAKESSVLQNMQWSFYKCKELTPENNNIGGVGGREVFPVFLF